MSHRLLNHNEDLKRLESDGYGIDIVDDHLVVYGIPYVNACRQVCYGDLVSALELSGDQLIRPSDHTVLFAGDIPCDEHGSKMDIIVDGSDARLIGQDIHVKYRFSRKPENGYNDYYDKMTTYANILMSQAHAIDHTATHRTSIVRESPDDSPFAYINNASALVGISEITNRVKSHSVAIIGLGGTGSYILDLVAKTPVKEIHLFDGDIFEQHNAFRSPGAASLDDIKKRPLKVRYYKEKYSEMHKGITAHTEMISANNINEIRGYDMTFICVDKPGVKSLIIKEMEESRSTFIDVGMGVSVVENYLIGQVRITTSTPDLCEHVQQHVQLTDNETDTDDPYDQNIQIADLNALNACLAVIRWKKISGIYRDTEREHHSVFTINSNHLLNDCK